jgi:predicted amidohydrolase YtcJ
VINAVDELRSLAEAVAIRGDRIVFVGNERGALTYQGRSTRVMDLDGLTVLPGFIDAHSHLAGLGSQLRILDLVGTRSLQAFVDLVAARAREVPEGQWIRGGGWDQNDWADKRMPHHRELAERVPDHPVMLGRDGVHQQLTRTGGLVIDPDWGSVASRATAPAASTPG